jgi:hypothetical protein
MRSNRTRSLFTIAGFMILSKTILLVFAALQPGYAHAQTPPGPRCLGPYCVDSNLSQQNLAKALGPYEHSPCCY